MKRLREVALSVSVIVLWPRDPRQPSDAYPQRVGRWPSCGEDHAHEPAVVLIGLVRLRRPPLLRAYSDRGPRLANGLADPLAGN